MDWKLKARMFSALAAVPFGSTIHFWLQRNVSKEWPRRDGPLGQLLVAAKRVYDSTEGHHGHMLEIGAGRDLAVAVALRLMGVGHVTCVDVDRLARPELIAHAAAYMARRLGVPVPSIGGWKELEEFGITYLAPTTLRRASLRTASFDAFYSIDTLEHIPVAELREALTDAKRLVRSGGLFVHCIDYSDHYARGDGDLSRFNFLTFPAQDWKPYNSRFQYVNRLRHSDYLALFAELGLTTVHSEPDVESVQKDILERVAPEFRRYDAADLFTIRAMIVAAT
jgi:SAM-dependent methyltransferase